MSVKKNTKELMQGDLSETTQERTVEQHTVSIREQEVPANQEFYLQGNYL